LLLRGMVRVPEVLTSDRLQCRLEFSAELAR
jgi:hypothetical protein